MWVALFMSGSDNSRVDWLKLELEQYSHESIGDAIIDVANWVVTHFHERANEAPLKTLARKLERRLAL